MAILDQVIEMQRGGMSNAQILANLQEQKISTKEISDAINQAQIKNALNENTMTNQNEQQSIMNSSSPPQEAPIADTMPMDAPQETGQDYYTETPQGYNQEYNASEYPQGSFDSDSITEIAQQVVEEEFKDYKKKTGDMVAFKNTTEEKMSDLSNRLQRIESTIDKLQTAIIQKVGEFGENTNYIRKDLENLHNTTSKLMNPLIDNLNTSQKKGAKKSSNKK
jgi:hypothetical protein